MLLGIYLVSAVAVGDVQRPWYERVIPEDKLRILVYSGDADTCVNTLWSQWWTSGLQGVKEIEPWRGWTTDNEVSKVVQL